MTVQNTVDASVARERVAALRAAFTPYRVRAVGLGLWRYDGGPWTALSEHPFR